MVDGIPQEGIFRTPDHAYYDDGRGPITSITTAKQVYDKSGALVGWAKNITAEFALAHLDILVTHRTHNTPVPECPPCAANLARRKRDDRTVAARKWLFVQSDKQRDEAADLGTRVHALAEQMGRGHEAEVPVGLRPYARQYERFLQHEGPTFRAIEYVGVNRTYDYAGTGDIIADIDGETWVIDIKTYTKDGLVPRDYYPDTGMQLAACERLEYVGRHTVEYPDGSLLATDIVPMHEIAPVVDRHGVLLIGTEDYRLIPYGVTQRTFEAFLNCLDLHRWRYGEATTIVSAA